MINQAYFATCKQLVDLGKDNIPDELISSTHLIYSSPATLAFNSPGAQGFGVKRAGLAIPGSIMLLVGPGCCGRNTTILSEMGGYSDRFFFYVMDETDIVTGRHLMKIPQAVDEICQALPTLPSMVMICMTCVDALLGTDMERVCKKAEQLVGLPVVPCYMYALTREGRKPPMVAVRQAVYSLLRPADKKGDVVNILGHFAPLIDECELYPLLKQVGVRKINEMSRCQTYEEYLLMSQANFNLVLNPESRLAAADLEERLHIPSIELTRLFQIDKIRKQYSIFAKAIGVAFDDTAFYEKAKESIQQVKQEFSNCTFSIGEGMNANPFELALALSRYGFLVKEIFANIGTDDFIYLKQLSVINPNVKIYSNLSPTMIYYDGSAANVDIAIGKDAAYYHPDSKCLLWNDERQPFGYAGVTKLFQALYTVMKKGDQ